MNTETVLDHVIFQLTPTRTRFELFVVAEGVTERVASGLLKPFLLHLQAAEEQLAKGGCSIKLEPIAHNNAFWFTKGTAERFVRFVNSPEVIERGSTVEMELLQLEETIKMQTLTSSRIEDPLLGDCSSISLVGDKSLSPYGKPRQVKKMRQESNGNDSEVGTNSKKQLLKALEARRSVLQKEQGMAFARAAAAGFELVHLLQLIMFAECFGASRLREACCNFVRLCKKAKISGFCTGDLNLIDQDISWALSSTACVCILKSMERAVPVKGKSEENTVPLKTLADPSVKKEPRFSEGAIGSDHPSIERCYQHQLPLSHANLSPPGQACEWPNSTDIYQGWPAVYTDMNGHCATFYGYNYGYSPGSQESFTTLSDMSPSALPGLFYSSTVTNQQSPKAQAKFKVCSSMDMNLYPSLKKLHIGHRGVKKSRMATQGNKSYELFTPGYEKNSSEMTDSSSERSDSSNTPSVVLLNGNAFRVSDQGDLLEQGLSRAEFRKSENKEAVREVKFGSEENRVRDSGELSSDSVMDTGMSSCWALSSGDSSTVLSKNKGRSRLDQCSTLSQTFDVISNSQEAHKTASDDNSVVLFEQYNDGSLAGKSKKRLDFEEPETHHKQKHGEEVKLADDSFFVRSPRVNHEHKAKPAIESEIQGYQIYNKMSKQALKVNSVVSNRRDPDDLLMLSRQRNHNSFTDSSDVLNIDSELRGYAECASKAMMGPEPSQERVKKFLDQYNEKREAKLRGDAISSKRTEREGKLKAMKEDLDKKRSDFAKSQRPERASLQVEARLRADKLRMFKADLQKSKKEKEEEERRRLDALKAQRQARIAARSNVPDRSITGRSSSTRGQMGSQPSTSKPSPATSKLPALQKSRTSLRDSQAMQIARSSKVHATWSSPKPAICPQPRSSTSSVTRRTERASVGSQPSKKTETLKGPQRTTSPPLRTNRVFSAVFGKDSQLRRSSLTGKMESSTTSSKKQGFLAGTRSSAPLERQKKGSPSKSRKEVPQSVNEAKLEGRTFLKKGSGTRTSSRSAQKTKSTSPHTAMTVDKRPLAISGMQASKLDLRQRSKTTAVALPRLTAANKSNSSTPLPNSSRLEMDSTKLGIQDACEVKEPGLVYLDMKPSIPRYLSTAIESSSTCLPGTGKVIDSRMNLEGAILDGQLVKSATPQMTLFDNVDVNMHSCDAQSTYPMPMVSGGVSPRPQSNMLQKLSSLGQMSMSTTASTNSENFKAGEKSHAGIRLSGNAISTKNGGQPTSFNGLQELRQTSSRTPPTPAVFNQGNHSSDSRGSATKASRPFSFLRTLRSKAAQTKWR